MRKAIRQFLDKLGRYNQVVEDYRRATESAPDHALAYVNWGIDLAQAGQMDEALAKFQTASEIAPQRYEPYLNWGVALAKMDRLEEAIEKFKLAIEKDGKAAGPYMLWGAALVEQGLFEEAKDKYERAVELSPNHPEPYVNRGIALARTGNYDEAISNFKQALSIHGCQPQVYFLWGAVLAELHDYDSALEKFKLTLRFIPKHAEAWYFMSIALNRLGRYEEALEHSRKALSYDFEKPEVYLNQGDILANLNRLDVAISNYRHAITLDDSLAEAYLGWGVALCRQGDYEAGYAQFRKAEELAPQLPGVARQWGHFLLEQKRYDEALKHLRDAVALESDEVGALLNLSMALIKTGQMQDAIQVLFEIEKKDKWNPQAHYMLGTHFMGAGDLNKAAEHLKKALAEKPDFEDASINLALTLCELGDTLEAVRCMRPLIRKSPDSPRVNFFYGSMLYRHGDYKEAMAKYQKALALLPAYVEPRIGLVEVYLKLSQLEDALNTLQVVLNAEPHYVPALFLQGIILLRQAEALTEAANLEQKQGLYQQALQVFKQVITLEPEHWDGWANQALLLGYVESLESMNAAFEQLLAQSEPSFKGMLLIYWAQALKQHGQEAAAEAKRQEALAEDPDIEAQLVLFSI